jgi:hypothetical protein
VTMGGTKWRSPARGWIPFGVAMGLVVVGVLLLVLGGSLVPSSCPAVDCSQGSACPAHGCPLPAIEVDGAILLIVGVVLVPIGLWFYRSRRYQPLPE